MRVEIDRLKNEPDTKYNRDLLAATSYLSMPVYECYKINSQRVQWELVMEKITDTDAQITRWHTWSTRYPNAPPRIFEDVNMRCTCNECLADLDMCSHEILLKDGFDTCNFLPQNLIRECVTGSLQYPPSKPNNDIDVMIGYDEECITDLGLSHSQSADSTDVQPTNFIELMSPPPRYIQDNGIRIKPMNRE